MTDPESLLDDIASDIMVADIEDLPGLSRIYEKLEKMAAQSKDHGILPNALTACAELIKKIILNEVPDKNSSWKVINEALTVIQGIVRDGHPSEAAVFPAELGLAPVGSQSIGAVSETMPEEEPPENSIINLAGADASLTSDFINEAREHLASAEQNLMDLETGSDYDGAINAIFRSFHTIKGAAGFLDLKPILVVAHESETLLDLGRKGTVHIEGALADVAFDSIDVLRRLMDGAEEALAKGGEFNGAKIISSILKTLRQIIKDPSVIPVRAVRERVGDKLIDMGVVSQDKIDEALEKRKDPEERIGETLVKQGLVPAKTVAKALREQQQVRRDKSTGATVKEMVKIDTERLDRLVDTIGELVIAESMVGQDEELLGNASHKVARNISHLNKITRELQEMGMAMRLVPVRATFQKLARAVRDLTRKSGKAVELKMHGEDTEVDRSIVELIGDPLMHMIRNSVDHGIETTEERSKTGKPAIGTVNLRAYHKGGNIHFAIEDDGRGLDKAKITAKAVERGLIEPGREMTDQEIYTLIFLPGFSTAAKVTEVSGRGVGMDVVKRNVEAMRGSIEITSEAGQGSNFIMKLPLTLAIIDGMLVDIEDEKYIIPTLSVVESLSLTPDMISTVYGRGELINLRGELLPLVRINQLFGLYPNGATDKQESTVVVVEENTRKIGLVVDKLLGQRQTVIKSLGGTFARQKWISGGAILSNGNIGLIIDIGGVISLASEIDARGNDGDYNHASDPVANRSVREFTTAEATASEPEMAGV